jgi:hypothetical protein
MLPSPVQESFTMRTTRILLAALSIVLVAACTAEPVAVVRPDTKPAFGAGFNGSGNAVAGDTTSVTTPERGAGFNGSGN